MHLYILYGFSTEDVSRMKQNALWNVLKQQSGGTYIKREGGGVGGRKEARKKTIAGYTYGSESRRERMCLGCVFPFNKYGCMYR